MGPNAAGKMLDLKAMYSCVLFLPRQMSQVPSVLAKAKAHGKAIPAGLKLLPVPSFMCGRNFLRRIWESSTFEQQMAVQIFMAHRMDQQVSIKF